MKLPPDSVISERKLREYLLSQRIEDDKSAFLALAATVKKIGESFKQICSAKSKKQKLNWPASLRMVTSTKSMEPWSDQTARL